VSESRSASGNPTAKAKSAAKADTDSDKAKADSESEEHSATGIALQSDPSIKVEKSDGASLKRKANATLKFEGITTFGAAIAKDKVDSFTDAIESTTSIFKAVETVMSALELAAASSGAVETDEGEHLKSYTDLERDKSAEEKTTPRTLVARLMEKCQSLLTRCANVEAVIQAFKTDMADKNFLDNVEKINTITKATMDYASYTMGAAMKNAIQIEGSNVGLRLYALEHCLNLSNNGASSAIDGLLRLCQSKRIDNTSPLMVQAKNLINTVVKNAPEGPGRTLAGSMLTNIGDKPFPTAYIMELQSTAVAVAFDLRAVDSMRIHGFKALVNGDLIQKKRSVYDPFVAAQWNAVVVENRKKLTTHITVQYREDYGPNPPVKVKQWSHDSSHRRDRGGSRDRSGRASRRSQAPKPKHEFNHARNSAGPG
jgi:hypothetical protein